MSTALKEKAREIVDPFEEVQQVASRSLAGDHHLGVVLQKENFRHREVCYLRAQGFRSSEIADRLGVTVVMVNYTLKQPWAQQFVLDLISRAGAKDVIEIFQRAAPKAALDLIEIAESAENDETRRKANNDLLDRVFGKPNQPVTHTQIKDPRTMSDAEIAMELAMLKERDSN